MQQRSSTSCCHRTEAMGVEPRRAAPGDATREADAGEGDARAAARRVLFEPKWDGFRCIVFRDGDEVELGSRNERPLTRYFPELIEPVRGSLPERCVVDGELVVVARRRRSTSTLLSHASTPPSRRVNMLAETTPASLRGVRPPRPRRRRPAAGAVLGAASALESLLAATRPPIHLTPATADPRSPPTGSSGSRAPGSTASWRRRTTGAYLEDKRASSR